MDFVILIKQSPFNLSSTYLSRSTLTKDLLVDLEQSSSESINFNGFAKRGFQEVIVMSNFMH